MGLWIIVNLIRILSGRMRLAIRLPLIGPAFMSVILVLAVFNGLCPFLGLKTNTNFGM